MGADARQVFLKVVLPAAAPQIFTGLRVALAQNIINHIGGQTPQT